MKVGTVDLDITRTGPTAKLILRATPYSHETPITLEELGSLITEFGEMERAWRRERARITVDYYTVLGVPREASAAEIRRAYRTQAKRQHPDVSSDETAAAMQQLNEAYSVLSDLQQRTQYDRTL